MTDFSLTTKTALRQAFLERRRRWKGAVGADRLAGLGERAIGRAPASGGGIIAGYWPMRHEMDVRPLMRACRQKGWRTALPVVTANDAPLLFRLWDLGDPLEDGPLRTRQPKAGSADVLPDVLLVPLLAFDRRGHRLGYGGGFYDRTLASLRARKDSVALGMAYAEQEIVWLPCESHDQPLDGVITEKNVFWFGAMPSPLWLHQ